MKTYTMEVEIDEGNDEFWEGVPIGMGEFKVREEVKSCLADHGFIAPGCRVKVLRVRATSNHDRHQSTLDAQREAREAEPRPSEEVVRQMRDEWPERDIGE